MRLTCLLSAALGVAFALALPGARAHAQTAMPGPLLGHTSLFQSLPMRQVARSWPPAAAILGPGAQCRAAIRAAERAAGIPNQLMAAIGRVESGRREPDGSIDPWPWSINAEGTDHVYQTKAEAVAAVRTLQSQGMRSIDVGCMQVNLLHHPDAFANLDQAFDPVANANYAAKFLLQLRDETGTWPTATAWYHSATPELGAEYQRRVMAVLPEEQQRPDAAPGPLLASNYANGYASGYTGGFANGYSSGLAAAPTRHCAAAATSCFRPVPSPRISSRFRPARSGAASPPTAPRPSRRCCGSRRLPRPAAASPTRADARPDAAHAILTPT